MKDFLSSLYVFLFRNRVNRTHPKFLSQPLEIGQEGERGAGGRGGGEFSRESSVTPKDLTFSRISVLSYFKDPNRGYFVQPVKNIEAKKCMTQ